MIKKLLIFIPFALSFGAMQVQAMSTVLPGLTTVREVQVQQELLVKREFSLANRYSVPSVNEVFKDNILLNLAYLSGSVTSADQIDWDTVRSPQQYEFVLQPGEVFTFHDGVSIEFSQKTVRTTNTHFNATDGYRSSGSLYGDGVCHFASLINWAATDAGLAVTSPVNHDFAAIPEIDPKYGTSIYYSPGEQVVNEQQNLYIENNFDKPIKFVFTYKDNMLSVSVYK